MNCLSSAKVSFTASTIFRASVSDIGLIVISESRLIGLSSKQEIPGTGLYK
jgi:hypothetical protein